MEYVVTCWLAKPMQMSLLTWAQSPFGSEYGTGKILPNSFPQFPHPSPVPSLSSLLQRIKDEKPWKQMALYSTE